MVGVEALIEREVAHPAMRRIDVAQSYSIALRQGGADFARINKAILTRWKPSGLEWIKARAWKFVGAL